MRTLIGLVAIVFVGAAALFGTVGLAAVERVRERGADLAARLQHTRRALDETEVLSYADVEALGDERDRLREQVGQRRSNLLDARLASPPPPLEAALERARLPALDKGQPLRDYLQAMAAGRPAVAAALARTLEVLRAAGVERLETLVFRNDGAVLPAEGIDGLDRIEFELVVVSEVPEVLAVLEGLVPGAGEPVLSVASASVRRIEPNLWGDGGQGLTSPPVRLTVTVAALFAAPPAGAGG
jgi:hypothetical protein